MPAEEEEEEEEERFEADMTNGKKLLGIEITEKASENFKCL